MVHITHFCRFCGSALPGGSKFCENCGAPTTPVEKSASDNPALSHEGSIPRLSDKLKSASQNLPETPLPPTSQSQVAQPSVTKRPNSCMVILGTIGCLLICLSLVVVATNFVGWDQFLVLVDAFTNQRTVPTLNNEDTVLVDMPAALTPIPKIEPTPTPDQHLSFLPLVLVDEEIRNPEVNPYPPIEQSSQENIRQQEISENSIFDNFSSTQFNWAQSYSEIAEFDYYNDGYIIHVKTPSYISWSELPVKFNPNEIEFDVVFPNENSGGSFGVICQIQDDANYYIVEIDVFNQVFSIAMVKNDELIPLTNPEWVPLTDINKVEGTSNHFIISCQPDQISVTSNNAKVGQSDFTAIEPFVNPGRMALFVATWENASSEGYWAVFDNLYAWK